MFISVWKLSFTLPARRLSTCGNTDHSFTTRALPCCSLTVRELDCLNFKHISEAPEVILSCEMSSNIIFNLM